MLQKIFATGTFLFTVLFSFAQIASVSEPVKPAEAPITETPAPEKKPFLNITGSADIYYRYDFNKQVGNNRTSFTNTHNDFALGMASVKFEHTGSKVGIVADLGYGQRAKEFAYNDEGITQAIKQLYITYSPADWLKFTAGTWATHIGYELVDPQLNRNYSMSYMFTNGPFTHTGLKVDVTKGKHGFMLGISNATDYRTLPDGQIDKKFVIAQYSVAPSEKVKLYLNYVGGQGPDTAKSSQIDIVATATVTKKFSAGFNGTVYSTKQWNGVKNSDEKKWWGAAVYLNVDPQDWFGLTLRSEIFNDKDALKGFNSSLFVNTLSANFKVEGFTFIPEIRIESAGDKIYADKTGAFAKKGAASFLLAAVYKF
jgi:Putative beta-barrel porin-2, OmpL-like. bbp2